jgi:hypothetical protein
MMGSFQASDALSILFEFENPPLEHLEGFILLSKKGGELQIFSKILDRKFQFKNSKKFPH